MHIYRLTTFTPEQYTDLLALMNVLSEHAEFSEQKLRDTIACPTTQLFVAEAEGHLVGCATLCTFCSPTDRKASVEDVVVSPAHRGQGIGRALMQSLLDAARALAPITLQLTSRPHRQAARALYASLGFTPKDTGFYKLTLTR